MGNTDGLVRVAAKELTALILDEDRLRSERSDRKLWKSRVQGLDEYQSHGNEPPPRTNRRRHRDEDDAEYRLAIEASKAEAEEDRKRRAKETMAGEEDEDLAKAIKLSREEEDLRKRELEESNAQSLFDDSTPVTHAQPTGYNQGYQQQGAVDWFGNPINTQQPMTTGYLNNQYAQPTGFANQPTGAPNGYTNGFQQPSGFDQNPYGQPQNNFMQPQPNLQPQQTAFNANNPYGSDMYSQQMQMQKPQEQFPSAGSNNPWAQTGSPQPPADSLKPMPTGSNNPFASRTQVQRPAPATTGPPSLNTLAEDRATNQFPASNPNPIANFQPQPQPQPQSYPAQPPPQAHDPHHARLNALLSTGDGQDTFGNTGDLRIPAQHTAPGTFVNSAGQGLDRLKATNTGNNPFFGQPQPQQQSFTGMPPQPGFVQPNSNPWGGPQHQQRQQGGSLIDL